MRELDDARYKAIGARIRDVRLQRNMSQAELAEKAFISVPHMSEVENGKTKLRLSTFVYITEALQVSADVLLRTNTPEVNGITKVSSTICWRIVLLPRLIPLSRS